MCDTQRRSKPLPPSEVARLYRKHGARIVALARRMLGDPAEAHDVMHEVFTRLLVEAPVAEAVIGRWLRGAATFACFKRKRDRAMRDRILAREWAGADFVDPHSYLPEMRAEARKALERMPSNLRGLAVKYYLREMTHEEIAASVGCSRRNIGYQLDRLRKEFEIRIEPTSLPRARAVP